MTYERTTWRNRIQGQLELPTPGALGGILIGGDVTLYRISANLLGLGEGDYFRLQTNSRLQFRETTTYINSGAAGYMDITSASGISLASPEVHLDEYIIHRGDVNTFIRYQVDDIILQAGGTQVIELDATGLGLFGETPVAQQAHLIDATDAATALTRIAGILLILERFGLMADA